MDTGPEPTHSGSPDTHVSIDLAKGAPVDQLSPPSEGITPGSQSEGYHEDRDNAYIPSEQGERGSESGSTDSTGFREPSSPSVERYMSSISNHQTSHLETYREQEETLFVRGRRISLILLESTRHFGGKLATGDELVIDLGEEKKV